MSIEVIATASVEEKYILAVALVHGYPTDLWNIAGSEPVTVWPTLVMLQEEDHALRVAHTGGTAAQWR
ncbi:MAG: hypothetical protein EOO38_31410 [Cytophagaceae bacterium]|nr:MAG: hypothetical protein EOO38_31410 [Cytophagaceae bacterium]